MEAAKWVGAMRGLALGAGYCIAYLVMRYLSFDQWFLPAGLRVACLLLLPWRAWPYIIAGDVAALLIIRVPMAERYSPLWSYLSPILLIGLISPVAAAARRFLPDPAAVARWLPLAAIALALWSSLCNLGLNYFLHGPRTLVTLPKFGIYCTGDFLGILMVGLPVLLWRLRRREVFSPRRLIRDGAIALLAILGLYALITLPARIDHALQLSLLMLMIVPAVFLTFFHGWRGSAMGVVAVNLAIAQTLTYTGIPGTHDDTVFLAQQALAIAAAALLILGTVISEHYDTARRSGIAEAHALKMARSSFLSTERVLREQLLYMAQMQLLLDDERRDLAESLKAHGNYTAAMDLNSDGVRHRRVFDEQAQALYPIRIEEQGLYAVVHSEAFTGFWAGGADVIYALRGQPRWLSVDLQLVAYRCICNAMALLSECDPDEYRIKMRTWRGRKSKGIALFISASPTAPAHASQAGAAADSLLSARVKAHGGIHRRHAHRVCVLLSESIDSPASSH